MSMSGKKAKMGDFMKQKWLCILTCNSDTNQVKNVINLPRLTPKNIFIGNAWKKFVSLCHLKKRPSNNTRFSVNCATKIASPIFLSNLKLLKRSLYFFPSPHLDKEFTAQPTIVVFHLTCRVRALFQGGPIIAPP